MAPDDVLHALRKRPFEPFRIEVSDGTAYEVRHPELVMVGLGAIIVGIPAATASGAVYQRVETVSLGHVVKLIPLTGAAAPGDGQQGG
jgi:hypothetical protein